MQYDATSLKLVFLIHALAVTNFRLQVDLQVEFVSNSYLQRKQNAQQNQSLLNKPMPFRNLHLDGFFLKAIRDYLNHTRCL